MFLMLLGVVLEALSVGFVVPLLAVMTDQGLLAQYAWIPMLAGDRVMCDQTILAISVTLVLFGAHGGWRQLPWPAVRIVDADHYVVQIWSWRISHGGRVPSGQSCRRKFRSASLPDTCANDIATQSDLMFSGFVECREVLKSGVGNHQGTARGAIRCSD